MTPVRRAILALLAVAALTGYAAPVATADDASLWNAYNAREDVLDRALTAYSHASHRYQRSHGLAPRRIKAVIRTGTLLAKLLDSLADDVRAEGPSSEAGTRARDFAARGFIGWKLSHLYENRALRALLRRRYASMDRWYRKSLQIGRRSTRYFKRADDAFAEAGFKPPDG